MIQRNLWILVIPVLLLAAALSGLRLADYPLDVDEIATARFSLGAPGNALKLTEVWATVSEVSPDQALGHPLLFAAAARLFGSSEFGLRLLSFFFAQLSLAAVYRVGRDFFGPRAGPLAGWLAAALLGSSVLFVTYGHVARPYILVVFFALLSVWGYWRLALRSRTDGADRAGAWSLVFGSVGIFYTHYYAVLLLAALALWHLLYAHALRAEKDRHWRRPLYCLALAALIAAPQFWGWRSGIDFVQTVWWHTKLPVLRMAEALPWLLQVWSNGVLRFPGREWPAAQNQLLLLALTLALPLAIWLIRRWRWLLAGQFLFTLGLAYLLLVLWVNEILLLVRVDRMRYFMALWPLSALLVGGALARSRGRWRRALAALVGAFIIYGIWANAASERRFHLYPLLQRRPIHQARELIRQYSTPKDALMIEDSLWDEVYIFEGYYFHPHFEDYPLLWDSLEARDELSRAIEPRLRFFMLANERRKADAADSAAESVAVSTAESSAPIPANFIECRRFLNRDGLALELYARSPAHCPREEPPLMVFGDADTSREEVALVGAEVAILPADILRADLLMHAASAEGMTAYSVALQVFDLASGEKVAQGDQGLWLGRYNPIRSEIDISALPAGEYELRVGLYEWQTLARVAGVDQISGARAELLPLYRFRVG